MNATVTLLNPMVVSGIEIGTTDLDQWIDAYLEATTLKETAECLEQMAFDDEADIAFETEVCWQEFDEQVFQEWEALYMRTALCLTIRRDVVTSQMLYRPGLLWALPTGGAEIDGWFNDYRTAKEVEAWEAGDV